MNRQQTKSAEGFSIVELLIVLIIISIMGGVTGYYLNAHQTLYKADEQTSHILDVFQQARQLALTQRGIMRVEIDLNDKVIRLIDENTAIANETDDEVIREVPLLDSSAVNIEQRAVNVATNPPEPLPAQSAVFTPSVYPPSVTHRVCTLRFRSDEKVVDEDNNPSGITLHVWSPSKTNSSESEIARAITVIGTTGSIRTWEYNFSSTAANKWKDSRRSGS